MICLFRSPIYFIDKTEKNVSIKLLMLMLNLGAHTEHTGLNLVFVLFQFKSASCDK